MCTTITRNNKKKKNGAHTRARAVLNEQSTEAVDERARPRMVTRAAAVYQFGKYRARGNYRVRRRRRGKSTTCRGRIVAIILTFVDALTVVYLTIVFHINIVMLVYIRPFHYVTFRCKIKTCICTAGAYSGNDYPVTIPGLGMNCSSNEQSSM